MNDKPLNINIMGRDFSIACPENEREEIQLAVAYLTEKIQEIKAEGKLVDSDRIVIVAALKITHELLALRAGNNFDRDQFKRRITALKKKIDEAIADKDR